MASQAESSVDISELPKTPNENLIDVDVVEEVSISNDATPPPKSPPSKQPEQLLFTNSYTLSMIALIFIAISMSTVVLMSPGNKSTKFIKNLDDYSDDDPTDGEATTENYSDVNSSYIHPEREKFEFIHGKLKDLSICLALFNISDLNGACLVHQAKHFTDASDLCNSHNMTLLAMNSDLEKQRVFDETEKIFGTGGGTRIWMNGRYSEAEGAFLTYPKNERFYVTNDQIENAKKYSERDCLAIESWYHGRYHISAVYCGGSHYFYCEF